jgi:hypothetical protein
MRPEEPWPPSERHTGMRVQESAAAYSIRRPFVIPPSGSLAAPLLECRTFPPRDPYIP